MTATLDPWLLEKLVCPVTRAPLRQVGDQLITPDGAIAYPIVDGVPVLLAEAGQSSLPRPVTADAISEHDQRDRDPE